MTDSRKYPRCDVSGVGYLIDKDTKQKVDFKLIDMSAEGLRINVDRELHENSIVDIYVTLKSLIFEVKISAEGIVKRHNENDTGIEFTNLSEADREEINGMMMSSCNLI